MNKMIKTLLAGLFSISFIGCQSRTVNNEQTSVPVVSDHAKEEGNENKQVLILYFSVMETDGTDTVSGASRVAKDGQLFGNTEYIARLIQKQTGGDLFQIETVQEYPKTHASLLEFAHNELDENARPELSVSIDNLDQYSTVFLGYPTWNADLPMPLYTFLETCDFGGKTIIPFNTHGGSGFAGTIQTISSLQPEATVVKDGLSISRNDVTSKDKQVQSWVASMESYIK